MSAESVRAILEGRKTQTRRVVKQDAITKAGILGLMAGTGPAFGSCPYGEPCDRLWVKETLVRALHDTYGVAYAEDHSCAGDKGIAPWQWKGTTLSALFMPRWASRITLEISEVRVERVQEISAEDVAAEGVVLPSLEPDRGTTWYEGKVDDLARRRFALLWDSINAKRGYAWETNPWVWAVTFRVLEAAT